MDNKTISEVKASKLQLFFYYFSFVLIYATLTFITGMFLLNYEDKFSTTDWLPEAKATEKVWFIFFYILEFPLGLLFRLFTGHYDNGVSSALLNPLILGWTLQKVILKTRGIITQRIVIINFTIWTILVLTMVIAVVTE